MEVPATFRLVTLEVLNHMLFKDKEASHEGLYAAGVVELYVHLLSEHPLSNDNVVGNCMLLGNSHVTAMYMIVNLVPADGQHATTAKAISHVVEGRRRAFYTAFSTGWAAWLQRLA